MTMQMVSHARRRAVLIVFVGALAVVPASGQDLPPATGGAPASGEDQPIGRFVVDARGAFPKFTQNATIASGIGVTAANLPTRALGLVAGAHWYPARLGAVTFGIGAEVLLSRASRTLKPATEDADPGPTVTSRFSALSPQVSFNFGKRDGYSYISGGIGRSTFTAEREEAPLPDPESRSKTINYGGGGRWFVNTHVAVSIDLRFYAVNPQTATSTRPGLPRMRLMVFSVGAGFR